MSKVRIELNSQGVKELLQSDAMMSICESLANNHAPEGCEVKTFVGKDRCHALIYPATQEAYQGNLDNNTLLKAIGG